MQGTPFGRYLLLEMLGRGGMGEVWRAHDTVTNRTVAIKVLSGALSDDPLFQARFRREALAAARLQSPHVVPIHDFGEIDGRLFVDMRLVEGRDLHDVLVADGPLAPERTVRIVEHVAEALHAAHAIGFVHRDVKPSNILVDANDFAYLIDFGIARAIDDTRMTGTGNAIGTFAYIAPERLTDHPDEDGRVDVYALTCVLYECLTGRPPFAGTSMASLVTAHLHTPPPRPSTAGSGIRAGFDDVIATGMAKDPSLRYATTTNLAKAARAALTSSPTKPAPVPARAKTPEATALWDPGPFPRVERKKRPVGVWVAALTIAALVVVLVVLGRNLLTHSPPQPLTSPPITSSSIPPRPPTVSATTESVAALPDTVQCGPGSSGGLLTNVSTGRHDTFDRIVLQFVGPAPTCKAEYVDQITQDGSGNPIPLGGNAFFSIYMHLASASPAAISGSPTDTPELANVRAMVLAGDFEGVVTIGVGMDERAHYKIFTLSEPTRVVIDIGH